MSEEELGFRPQRAVRWLDPGVLVSTGARSLMAGVFGAYADKRELQGTLPATTHTIPGDELWFDYVADLGDGFDATYSVASLIAAPRLDVGQTLPRGRLLVMGGDQVYPAATTEAYEDRSKGLYRAALPVAPPEAPRLFALPGNHDWYDGLTSFLRVFAQGRSIGGWATEQTRSYFAIELPARWWLFAVDTQFDDYVDAPQLAYFRAAASRLGTGDAVILCTPTPAWVPAGSGGRTKAYDTIRFLMREVIGPTGATVPLMLTGDKHHYARYAERDGTAQRITAGLGGAYLAGTHRLPAELVLPPAETRVPGPPATTRFDLAGRYPGQAESVRLAAGILRLPWRNPGFWRLTGLLQSAMTLAVLFGLAKAADPVAGGVVAQIGAWFPAVFATTLLVLGAVAFARLDLPRTGRTNAAAGVLHALAHLALSVGWAFTVRWLDRDMLPEGATGEWLLVGVVVVLTPLLVGFLAAEVVALYLLAVNRFGINSNELFAGQGVEDHKGFLRLHIGRDGTLTVYPLKLARICRRWRPNPDGAPTEPWLLPREELAPELIEEPIRIPRDPGGPPVTAGEAG
ncbi:hypothetical protein BU204_01385 [Actinophytocola xanthii]|uniref:Metallophosphoesterase n=2 Tax=Actinophytocola xanthii TaxID=1912961 RepID=A0A1Q8CZ32_9PSEU|nr:hypothetical protein BU204_01385 [Actinophytocola xanthii]